MKAGMYTINGRDAWTEYGLLIERGSASGLLALPEPKARVAHAWEDEDGEEVLLTPAYTKARNVTLSCLIAAASGDEFWLKYSRLYNELASGMVALYVREFDETYELLLTGFGKPKKYTRISEGEVRIGFSIELKEPCPTATTAALADDLGNTPVDDNEFYLS